MTVHEAIDYVCECEDRVLAAKDDAQTRAALDDLCEALGQLRKLRKDN